MMNVDCPIYSIRFNGVFNVPFVALNDAQAIEIVYGAIDRESFVGSFDLVKIGLFGIEYGVESCIHTVVKTFDYSFTEVQNEVQESL